MIDLSARNTEAIPFDNQDFRTIRYSVETPQKTNEAIEVLRASTSAVEDDKYVVTNPVIAALTYQKALASGDKQGVQLAKLIEQMATMSHQIADLQEEKRLRERRDAYAAVLANPFDLSAPGIPSVTVTNPLTMPPGIGGLAKYLEIDTNGGDEKK